MASDKNIPVTGQENNHVSSPSLQNKARTRKRFLTNNATPVALTSENSAESIGDIKPQPAPRRQSSRASRQSSRSEQSDTDGDGVDSRQGSGRRDNNVAPRRQDSKVDPNAPPRLLIVSSKIKNSMLMQTAVLPNVTFVQYKFETASLSNILSSVSQHLGSKKVLSIAFLAHSTNSSIYISGKDDKTITTDSVSDNRSLVDFFETLSRHLDKSKPDSRVDFLACSAACATEGSAISKDLENIMGVPVGISRDVAGSDIQLNQIVDDGSRSTHVGELYFRMERLRWSGTNQQSLAGFEKIRTVGKGAYGTAVLYSKKDDDSLVILKEINLHEMTASERQMALNEVRVLAMMDHPNIISYYDSFEEDGVVMIEMEYADGGTLSQFLGQQNKPLSEREILATFTQIVSAIKFIHEHNILHRDLKTANIFLTKEGRVKVGDFGISKLMSTANQGANTVLGTPYYISPEMCEGKPYNDKSDIWALGCVLYEMACLQRTFEGSNLPALVNKIMKGQFAPVKGDYSQEFKNLVMSMLQREPEYRPSATELWHHKLPELMKKYEEDPVTDYDEDGLSSSGNNTLHDKRKTRSVLYYFEMVQMQLTPISLPSRIRVRDVAVSNDHVIVVTVEQMVYTWGDGSQGQLGHGDLEPRNTPELVEALKGKSIVRACSGSGFSIFASDNGIVMTCGDGTSGCLGHGDWCSTSRPRLIEALLSVDVACIACGPHHVVAVGSEGEVFTWGSGADGRLGLGNMQSVCQPMEVVFTEPLTVRECYCGQNGTMLLTDVGSVWACGNNDYNKLGLNHRVGFLMAMKNIFNKSEVSGVTTFHPVRALARHRVVSLHMGPSHCAVIVEPGFLYTFGKNSEGQLGTGNLKQQGGPIEVKVFEEKPANRVQCGAHFTVAGTSDNDLLFWGTRYKKPARGGGAEDEGSRRDLRLESASSSSSRGHSRQHSTASVSSVGSVRDGEHAATIARINPETGEGTNGNTPTKNIASVTSPSPSSTQRQHSTNKLLERQGSGTSSGQRVLLDRQGSVGSTRGPDRQGSVDSLSPNEVRSGSQTSLGAGGFKPLGPTPRRQRTTSTGRDGRDDTEMVLQPAPLIRMDSSGSHSQAGDTVTLSQFFCHGENLFIQVETTAPPPKRQKRKKRAYMRRRLSALGLAVPEGGPGMSTSSRDGGDEYSSEASELDSCGTTRSRLLTTRLGRPPHAHYEMDTMSTLGSIPPWLKEELANSEMTDGHDPDSDHSGGYDDGHRGGHTRGVESSMSSIRINRDLQQHGPKTKAQRSENSIRKGSFSKHIPLSGQSHSLLAQKSSCESGVDLPATDPLYSSSSSENMAASHAQQGPASIKTPLVVSKKTPAAVTKRHHVTPTPGPAVVKSKAGPSQGQKPLSKIRAQGKTRSSDPKEPPRPSSLVEPQHQVERLQAELQRLHDEKLRAEARLRAVEEDNLRQRADLSRAAEVKAKEQEQELKTEIQNLREDMRHQNHQLKDNLDVVLRLQAQLERVQTEQMRLRESRPESRQSQRESKICVLQ